MKWESCKYSQDAKKYYRENHEEFIKMLLKHKIKAERILDIGCGNGELTIKVAKAVNAREVYGVDIDEQAIKNSKRKGIEAIKHDIEKGLPFESNFFDLVTANQVFEHINNTKLIFAETFRILKSGGYALISTPNIASWHNIIMLLLGMQPISYHVYEVQVGNFLRGVRTHGHVKAFTLPALVEIAELHGFKVVDTYGCGFYKLPTFLSKPLSKIDKKHAIYIGVLLQKP